MARVLICLVLCGVFSFMSYSSFMSHDYGPLKQWISYYEEYKALQGALDKGSASKAELLEKLKKMYPEKADEIERQFRAKYGDVKDSASKTESSLEETLREVKSNADHSNERTTPKEETTRQSSVSRPSQSQQKASSTTTKSTQKDNSTKNDKSGNQNNR